MDTNRIMESAVEILSKEEIAISFEYPGFINILKDGIDFSFGDVNEYWSFDYSPIGEEGSRLGGKETLAYSATLEEFLEYIRRNIQKTGELLQDFQKVYLQ